MKCYGYMFALVKHLQRAKVNFHIKGWILHFQARAVFGAKNIRNISSFGSITIENGQCYWTCLIIYHIFGGMITFHIIGIGGMMIYYNIGTLAWMTSHKTGFDCGLIMGIVQRTTMFLDI